MTAAAESAGAVDRYAVAGHPVAHSLSPQIHAAFARQTGQALHYDRLPCPLDAFEATVRRYAGAGDGRTKGCNITLPFKFAAFAMAARTTSRARLAGACNTLRFDAGGWVGDNTDGAGLIADLERRAGVQIRGCRVLLVGAGGAAAGTLGALLAAGAREVTVANRTLARAEALVASHAAAAAEGNARLIASRLDVDGEAWDVVINATASSVADAPLPVHARVLAKGACAIDLMYGAAARPFVSWAEAHGAHARDGLGMLVEQAAEAFSFWRGVRPETDHVYAALRAELDAR